MKRFVDVRGQGLQGRFAWFDTIYDKFEEHCDQMRWSTFYEFKLVCESPDNIERYKALCPDWAFETPTEAEKNDINY